MTQQNDKLYQQLIEAGVQAAGPSEDLRRRVLAAARAAVQESAPGDESMVISPEREARGCITHDPSVPAVRPVPDVPTELADGVLRETHPIEQPPGRRHVRRRFVAMFHSKTVRWSFAAAVAAAVVLAVGLWSKGPGRDPGSAFAAAIEQFQKAKTIVCRITTSTLGGPADLRAAIEQGGKVYVSADYGSRCEMSMNGTPMLIQYAPLNGPAMTVTPPTKTYTVFDRGALTGQGQGRPMDTPGAWLTMLSKLQGRASRELGQANVDGVASLGYEISGELLGLGSMEGVRSELWVDAGTNLPVRYVAEMPMPQLAAGAKLQMVFDQFEWDTPLDAKLFTPDIPADYTRIDTKAPVADEAALIKALGNFAELTDKYPTALNPATVSMELATSLGRKIAMARVRGEKAPDQQEIMQKSAEISSGLVYYGKLAGRSPEYFGKTVTPGQKDVVLARWKTEDGQSRVIYGDLRVETLPNQ